MRSIDGEVPAIHPPNQAFRPRNVSGAIFCVRIIARQVKGDSKMGKNEKTKSQSPNTIVWQNTAYMLSVAWDTRRSVPLLVVLLAVCTAGKTTAEMLISPAVLGKLESGAPLGQLLGAIGGFTILLFALTALCYYIDHLTMFGRCGVRLELLKRINTKRTRTAYANLLDEAFRLMYQKGHDACMNNRASGEAFLEKLDGYHDKSHRLRGVSGSAVRAEPLALCPDGPDRCGELFFHQEYQRGGATATGRRGQRSPGACITCATPPRDASSARISASSACGSGSLTCTILLCGSTMPFSKSGSAPT